MANTQWRRTLPFCVCAFCMDTVSGIYLVCLPFLAMDYGAESLQLGYVDASRSTVYAVCCLLGGYVFRRYNRKWVMVLSCGGMILALGASWGTGSLRQVYLAVFMWSVTLSLFWPAIFAWLGDTHSDASLGPACSAVNLSWSLGIMAGSAIGGWLYARCAQGTFLLAMLPLPLVALLVFLNPRSGAPSQRDQDHVAQAGSWLALLSAYTGNVAVCVLLGVLEAVFPALGRSIGFEAAAFGSFMRCSRAGPTSTGQLATSSAFLAAFVLMA